MAQVAYELERFAPAKTAPVKRSAVPAVRVVKRVQNIRHIQRMKMIRTLLTVAVLVVLVCGVLQTQATLTEVQSNISSKEAQLTEEQALSAYLNFEFENMSSLNKVEELATGMGFEKITNGQITYFRMEEDNSIQVRENPLQQLLSGIFGEGE